jgi:hypothetical protein
MTAILEPPVMTPEAATRPPAATRPAALPTPARPAPAAAAAPVVPPAAPPVAAPVRAERPPRRIFPMAHASRAVAALTLTAWTAAVLVEPTPNGPQPVPAGWEVLLSFTTLLVLGAAVWGLSSARRWGPAAGALNGGLLVTSVALCPVSGHHVIAGWWWAQLGLSAAMLAAPVGLLLARRAGRLR